jgi:hypothetical protein
VTNTLLSPASRPGLLGKLMAAVRPEFRADELVFDPADPVFGGEVCRVDGCGRTARGHGLCQGHRNRWAKQGRPDLEMFAATTDPRWRKHAPLMCCAAAGCRRVKGDFPRHNEAGFPNPHQPRPPRPDRPDQTDSP